MLSRALIKVPPDRQTFDSSRQDILIEVVLS